MNMVMPISPAVEAFLAVLNNIPQPVTAFLYMSLGLYAVIGFVHRILSL